MFKLLSILLPLMFSLKGMSGTLTGSKCQNSLIGNQLSVTCTASETDKICTKSKTISGNQGMYIRMLEGLCRAELLSHVQVKSTSSTKEATPKVEIKSEEDKEFELYKEAYLFCKHKSPEISEDDCKKFAFGVVKKIKDNNQNDDCSKLQGKDSGECDGSRWERVDENNLAKSIDNSMRFNQTKDRHLNTSLGEKRSSSATGQ